MFYDRFVALCVERGKSPTAVAKEMKLSPSTVANWKNGKEPFLSTLHKIANYFGVPVSVLKGEEPPKEKAAVHVSVNNGIIGDNGKQDFDGDAFLKSILDEFESSVSKAYEQGKKEAALTDDERELLRLYRRAEEADKQKILSMIRAAFG